MLATTPTSLPVLTKDNALQLNIPPSRKLPSLQTRIENGILDGSFGQVVSFASSYQTSFRIEVPLWHKVEDGVAILEKEQQATAIPRLAKPVLPDNVPSPASSSDAIAGPLQGANIEAEDADEEEAEEETYLTATGQGCYSFHISLLQRAAQTFSKRSLADKSQMAAYWPGSGRLTKKLAHVVQTQDLRNYSPMVAAGTFPTWICVHRTRRRKKALRGSLRAIPV